MAPACTVAACRDDGESVVVAAEAKAWLARRPHWHVHFTPTSASWLNQVERCFAELTRKQLQRGVHRSTRQLEADIRAFIETHNESFKPFKWTKSADDIFAAVKRFCLRVKVREAGRIVPVGVTVAVAVNDQGRRVVSAFVAIVFAQDDAEAVGAQWRLSSPPSWTMPGTTTSPA